MVTEGVVLFKESILGIAILGYLTWGAIPCLAYNVTVETTGAATIGKPLEEYERNVLTRVAALSKGKRRSDNARCIVTINQDGGVVGVKVVSGSDSDSNPNFHKKLKAERFAKIPGVADGSLKLDFSFAELSSPPYTRGNIAIQGNTLILGDGNTDAVNSRKQVLPAPYSEDDRKFDKEIVALYKQVPAFNSRLYRGSNEASEDELQSEFQKFRKRENWAGACSTILILLRKPVEKSELTKVKELLEMLEDMSAKLDAGGKRSVALGLIELSTNVSHRSENVVGTELLLRQAEVVLNSIKSNEPSIRLALARALARHYQLARNQEQVRNANLDVLKYTLAVEPVEVREAIRAYQAVLRDQMSTRDQSGAQATLEKYRAFVEKRLGTDSLDLIPVMVSALQIETTEAKRVELINSISKMVNSYRSIPTFSTLGYRRNEVGRSAVEALRSVSYSRNSGGAGAQPLRDDEILALARLTYKLQLKTSGFDSGIFSNLCRVLDSQGKFEQVVTLYRETVAFLDAGGDSRLGDQLPSLRHGYASALKKVGGNATTDSVMKTIDEAEEKRAKAAIDRAELRIAEMEKQPTPDAMRLFESRLSLIQLYRKDDDKKIVTQLERMRQDLRKAPDDRIRSGFEMHFVHRIRGNQRLLRESVFEKPLVDLFGTLDERIPGGLSQNAIRSLSFPRFGTNTNPNLDAILKVLGDRGRTLGR